MLKVEAITKSYGSFVAVRDLSFHVQPGRILGLLGPNGAGKTTALRTVAGILPIQTGRVSIAGHDLLEQPAQAKRQAAYVPDEPALFDLLTVTEHLEFIANVYGVDTVTGQAEQLLRTFDLYDHRHKLGNELSRGMRQKLALCMTWLYQPRVIMLDEPMTGLDPRGMRRLKDLVRTAAAAGTSFVVSSHQLDVVEDLATDLLILVGGRTRFFGTIDEAHARFGSPGGTDLEELFFHLTEAADPELRRGAA